MKNKTMMVVVALLVLSMLLVGCEPKGTSAVEATQAQQGEPAAAETEAVSEPETAEETAGIVEEEPHCLTSCEEINVENITSLQQLAQVGRGRITDIAASPDSAHLAVAVMTGVYIFDTQSLDQLFYIADGTLMYSVAYAPDGSDLAIGSYDAVYFYTASTYEKRAALEGAYGTVSDLIYSPDEVTLGAQVTNRRVILIDPLTLEDTQIGAQNWFTRFAFSPDGSQVLLAGASEVEIISVPAGQAAGELAMGDCTGTGQVTLVEDTQNEVYACNAAFSLFSGGQVSLTNPAGTQTGAPVSILASDPAGSQKIAAGRTDGSVQVWDTAGLEAPLWESSQQHPTQVTSLAFLPNGTILFSASNTEVRKWDASSGEDMGMVLGFSNPVNQISFSADGSKLAYVAGDAVYELELDACYGQTLTPTLLTELSEDTWSATISSDHSTLASIVGVSTGVQYEYEMTVEIIPLRNGGGRVEIPLEDGYSSKHAIFSPDGQVVAIGMEDTVYLYDLSGTQLGALTQQGEYVSAFLFSPDGTTLVVVYNSGLIGVFDLGSLSASGFYPGLAEYAYAMSISPDGSLLAVGYSQGMVQVYDLETGEVVQIFSGSESSISQIVFLGGEILITVSYDLKLTVWDMEDGSSIAWLNLTGTGYSMQLSPDGRVLAVGGYDGMIRFFGIPCEDEPSSPEYPALQTGALPAAPQAEVSQSCIVVVAPPSGGSITYALEEGFHKITFPAGSTPDPKETILWGNFTRAEESGGILTIWLEEGDTTVELNAEDGSVKVTIPGCYPAP